MRTLVALLIGALYFGSANPVFAGHSDSCSIVNKEEYKQHKQGELLPDLLVVQTSDGTKCVIVPSGTDHVQQVAKKLGLSPRYIAWQKGSKVVGRNGQFSGPSKYESLVTRQGNLLFGYVAFLKVEQ